MRFIPLRNKHGTVIARTTVDDEDYRAFGSFRWYKMSSGYAGRTLKNPKRRMVLLHRAILWSPTGMTIDHINRNRLDNRRKNLRVVTQSQNNLNKKSDDCHQSHNKTNKWRATIQFGRKIKHLGYFRTKREAQEAKAKARRELLK